MRYFYYENFWRPSLACYRVYFCLSIGAVAPTDMHINASIKHCE